MLLTEPIKCEISRDFGKFDRLFFIVCSNFSKVGVQVVLGATTLKFYIFTTFITNFQSC